MNDSLLKWNPHLDRAPVHDFGKGHIARLIVTVAQKKIESLIQLRDTYL